jgi:hypothetical protein
MKHSIQEYCKKINRELSIYDIGSLLAVTLGILGLYTYLAVEKSRTRVDVVYQEGVESGVVEKNDTSLPFGSKNGKTYTFTWCQGSSRILEKNKIIFGSEDEAQKSGRTMSKLCKK